MALDSDKPFANGTPAPDRRIQTIGLLMLGLTLLWIGNFIQFDDTSGFGSNDWLMPFDLLALVAAGASLVVSLPDLRARRLLGAALLVLDCLLVGLAVTDPGFRFIWSGDEGELFMFEVALGISGLALLTRSMYRQVTPVTTGTPMQPDSSTSGTPELTGEVEMTGWARFVAYLTATVLLVFVAFFLGVAHFEYTECSGPDFGGECDLAVLGGFVWSAGVILLALVAIPTIEIVLHARRRSRG